MSHTNSSSYFRPKNPNEADPFASFTSQNGQSNSNSSYPQTANSMFAPASAPAATANTSSYDTSDNAGGVGYPVYNSVLNNTSSMFGSTSTNVSSDSTMVQQPDHSVAQQQQQTPPPPPPQQTTQTQPINPSPSIQRKGMNLRAAMQRNTSTPTGPVLQGPPKASPTDSWHQLPPSAPKPQSPAKKSTSVNTHASNFVYGGMSENADGTLPNVFVPQQSQYMQQTQAQPQTAQGMFGGPPPVSNPNSFSAQENIYNQTSVMGTGSGSFFQASHTGVTPAVTNNSISMLGNAGAGSGNASGDVGGSFFDSFSKQLPASVVNRETDSPTDTSIGGDNILNSSSPDQTSMQGHMGNREPAISQAPLSADYSRPEAVAGGHPATSEATPEKDSGSVHDGGGDMNRHLSMQSVDTVFSDDGDDDDDDDDDSDEMTAVVGKSPMMPFMQPSTPTEAVRSIGETNVADNENRTTNQESSTPNAPHFDSTKVVAPPAPIAANLFSSGAPAASAQGDLAQDISRSSGSITENNPSAASIFRTSGPPPPMASGGLFNSEVATDYSDSQAAEEELTSASPAADVCRETSRQSTATSMESTPSDTQATASAESMFNTPSAGAYFTSAPPPFATDPQQSQYDAPSIGQPAPNQPAYNIGQLGANQSQETSRQTSDASMGSHAPTASSMFGVSPPPMASAVFASGPSGAVPESELEQTGTDNSAFNYSQSEQANVQNAELIGDSLRENPNPEKSVATQASTTNLAENQSLQADLGTENQPDTGSTVSEPSSPMPMFGAPPTANAHDSSGSAPPAALNTCDLSNGQAEASVGTTNPSPPPVTAQSFPPTADTALSTDQPSDVPEPPQPPSTVHAQPDSAHTAVEDNVSLTDTHHPTASGLFGAPPSNGDSGGLFSGAHPPVSEPVAQQPAVQEQAWPIATSESPAEQHPISASHMFSAGQSTGTSGMLISGTNSGTTFGASPMGPPPTQPETSGTQSHPADTSSRDHNQFSASHMFSTQPSPSASAFFTPGPPPVPSQSTQPDTLATAPHLETVGNIFTPTSPAQGSAIQAPSMSGYFNPGAPPVGMPTEQGEQAAAYADVKPTASVDMSLFGSQNSAAPPVDVQYGQPQAPATAASEPVGIQPSAPPMSEMQMQPPLMASGGSYENSPQAPDNATPQATLSGTAFGAQPPPTANALFAQDSSLSNAQAPPAQDMATEGTEPKDQPAETADRQAPAISTSHPSAAMMFGAPPPPTVGGFFNPTMPAGNAINRTEETASAPPPMAGGYFNPDASTVGTYTDSVAAAPPVEVTDMPEPSQTGVPGLPSLAQVQAFKQPQESSETNAQADGAFEHSAPVTDSSTANYEGFFGNGTEGGNQQAGEATEPTIINNVTRSQSTDFVPASLMVAGVSRTGSVVGQDVDTNSDKLDANKAPGAGTIPRSTELTQTGVSPATYPPPTLQHEHEHDSARGYGYGTATLTSSVHEFNSGDRDTQSGGGVVDSTTDARSNAPSMYVSDTTARRTIGRPAVPFVSFGFGGSVAVVNGRDAQVKVSSVGSITAQTKYYQALATFPGPLLPNTDPTAVLHFLQQKSNEAYPDNLIYDFLAFLVKNKGMGTQADNGGRTMSQDLVDLLITTDDESAFIGVKQSQSEALDQIGLQSSKRKQNTVARNTAMLKQITQLMTEGKQQDAVVLAVDEGMWACALAMSSHVDALVFHRVLLRYAIAEFPPRHPMLMLFVQYCEGVLGDEATEFAGQNSQGSAPETHSAHHRHTGSCDGMASGASARGRMSGDHNDNTSSDDTSGWRENLCMLLSNRDSADGNNAKNILRLGDRLLDSGHIHGAHVCFMCAGEEPAVLMPGARFTLIGKSFHDGDLHFPDCNIQLTEMYEYANALRNPRFTLPALQPFKLVHAARIADMGFVDQAVGPSEAIAKPAQWFRKMASGVEKLNAFMTTTLDDTDRPKGTTAAAVSEMRAASSSYSSSQIQDQADLVRPQPMYDPNAPPPPFIPVQNHATATPHMIAPAPPLHGQGHASPGQIFAPAPALTSTPANGAVSGSQPMPPLPSFSPAPPPSHFGAPPHALSLPQEPMHVDSSNTPSVAAKPFQSPVPATAMEGPPSTAQQTSPFQPQMPPHISHPSSPPPTATVGADGSPAMPHNINVPAQSFMPLVPPASQGLWAETSRYSATSMITNPASPHAHSCDALSANPATVVSPVDGTPQPPFMPVSGTKLMGSSLSALGFVPSPAPVQDQLSPKQHPTPQTLQQYEVEPTHEPLSAFNQSDHVGEPEHHQRHSVTQQRSEKAAETGGGVGGWFSSIKSWLPVVPQQTEEEDPWKQENTIKWDPVEKKWIDLAGGNEPEEEETAPAGPIAPPPMSSYLTAGDSGAPSSSASPAAMGAPTSPQSPAASQQLLGPTPAFPGTGASPTNKGRRQARYVPPPL
ncbi:hypothetical protein SARC_02150 [Sphaeroforma arctica JP610]|uniref:Sec16 Sec23-binding domain-containing protein n=1 Tax=Sphaeroforma arctica JP610 TaxID=667725 RepID=A0A0L0G9W8_9EUKA|nr:hypothetical protein SARC_02150 [Sphaeroforma arctica JP610]KNC85666.1 hypothetical protein SARC_02150 [Sphaeroforma arctica JP610]|eukprot:XP_014159568.1 hypothetical protein SARC_02150 [Sphaeroforma arctica JP610]